MPYLSRAFLDHDLSHTRRAPEYAHRQRIQQNGRHPRYPYPVILQRGRQRRRGAPTAAPTHPEQTQEGRVRGVEHGDQGQAEEGAGGRKPADDDGIGHPGGPFRAEAGDEGDDGRGERGGEEIGGEGGGAVP